MYFVQFYIFNGLVLHGETVVKLELPIRTAFTSVNKLSNQFTPKYLGRRPTFLVNSKLFGRLKMQDLSNAIL